MTERQYKDSSVDWIGSIPNHWKTTRIKFVGETKSGDEIRKENVLDYGQYPVYGGGKKIGYYNDYNTSINDILIGRVGSCGKINLPMQKAWATDNAIILSAKNNVNFKFLSYCLNCIPLETMVTQTAQPLLTATSILNCIIPLIKQQEQRSIVNFLNHKISNIDEAISRNNQMIEKLEEYKKSVISKVVTKGLNENIEMKDSEIEWIGDVPESWDIIPLKVLFKENKKRNSELINNNLLSLSYGRIVQKDIYSNYGLLPDNFSKYTIINEGDIVLRLTDLQNDHKSLRTGLVTQSGIITSAYVTLTPKKKLCSRYFHYLLHSYDIQKVFYTMGEGIRQNLNYDELSRNIRLVKPPLKEQQSIANYLDSKCLVIDESIKQSKKIIQKFEEYKKSIIYNAVTGKIDCRKEIVHE